MSFTLAIVGRPNVGKSTLFNRLVGRRLALVDDQPGVTRDLREGAGRLGPLRFTIIDTAGLEEATDDSLPGRMRALTERAVDMADVCLFLIDARVGVTATDRVLAELLRKRAPQVILAANKAEGRAAEQGLYDAYELGLGEPLALSAEHGIGMDDLLRALEPVAERFEDSSAIVDVDVEDIDDSVDEEGEGAILPPGRPIQIAVVGRPNAGKSTLVNKILGEDRLLTGPEAGITRDAIAVSLDWEGTPFRIFDTAGMRKKAKVQEKLEKLSVSDGLRAVKFAEVVVVLLDVQIPFETQDLRIADLAEREGRAVVVAVNKWDLEEDKSHKLNELREAFGRLLPQLRGAPMVMVSALTGKGLDRLHAAIVKAHAVWNARISTARLNRWLSAQIADHPPPAPGGRRIRLRYMTQVKTRPPTFVVFCSHPDAVPEDYKRFLVNGLRRDFDMPGTPIRLYLRAGENPYKNRKKQNITALDKHKARRVRD
ncbi:MAG: ribosome biogenesis GTPase Der [Rhodovulum sulfidophilum]|uniref:GTPase Der n=1 Tax=Rhodovulum sulfidophilum TaxID=35806 RepID=A0A2W5Q252_RHOSU|nr:MAG: ribosome biogenesis GTPase Der [Rhodovulum sulfidophilum]